MQYKSYDRWLKNKYLYCKKGDTLYSIARRFNITVESLKEYNGLLSNTISIGQVLYLHHKTVSFSWFIKKQHRFSKEAQR